MRFGKINQRAGPGLKPDHSHISEGGPQAVRKSGLLLRSTAGVTLCTVLGLALGFIREVLIIRHWGASAVTDAIVAAVFLPESIRMMLSNGIIVSAALPLWAECRRGPQQRDWSVLITCVTLVIAAIVVLLFRLLDNALVHVVAPGLGVASAAIAGDMLHIVAWVPLGVTLHAVLTIYHHADGRFAVPALGSVIFNGVVSASLWVNGAAATPETVAWSFVLGSALMGLPLIPYAWRQGWRPIGRLSPPMITPFALRFWPLLVGGLSGQSILLIERALASLAGEGSIALINLARKFVQLPAVAIHSLALVVMGRIAGGIEHRPEDHLSILRTAMTGLTLLTWPAVVVCLIWAPIMGILLPPGSNPGATYTLANLLRLYAPALVFGGWSTIIARYLMATGTTLKPIALELVGVAQQIALMAALFPAIGLLALPAGYSVGYASAALLLVRRTPLSRRSTLIAAQVIVAGVLTAGFAWLYPFHSGNTLLRQAIEAGLCYGAITLLGMAVLGRSLRRAV
jgi:peptidoglycan biosynthesis protein MviN/MurJ (putative lipid II flippase)